MPVNHKLKSVVNELFLIRTYAQRRKYNKYPRLSYTSSRTELWVKSYKDTNLPIGIY